MNPGPRDVAQTRLDNAMLLFDEFVHATIKHPDAATLRGLEGRFAERLQIQPSYWSQIKSRSRQIGERLARQFEQLCHKPFGWMDQPHGVPVAPTAPPKGAGLAATLRAGARSSANATANTDDAARTIPQDDDERFIVGLVLSYYRLHPQRARTRLLDLLGEVLAPAGPPASAPPPGRGKAHQPAPGEDGHALWSQTQAAVAPLKRKR